MAASFHNSSSDENKHRNSGITKVTMKNYEIIMNHHVFNINPTEILKQLYFIRHDPTLTAEEKRIKMQEIIKQHMG